MRRTILSLFACAVFLLICEAHSQILPADHSCFFQRENALTGIQALLNQANQKAAAKKCFDPTTHPAISKMFRANFLDPDIGCDWYENEKVIQHIHQMILAKSKELEMDPRLVYIRMLGESRVNPMISYGEHPMCMDAKDIRLKKNNYGFGIFQFYGKPYRDSKTHGQHVLDLMVENEKLPLNKRRSPREIQIEYYLDRYVAPARAYANTNPKLYACKNGKKWKHYTHLQKLAYLGYGDCSQLEKARKTIMSNQNYKYTGASRLFSELVDQKIPLCSP